MTSTPMERLALAEGAWFEARDRKDAEILAAGSEQEAQRIERNARALESAWLEAVQAALDATGPAVEQAYDLAVAAKAAVDAAYRQEKSLVEKIGLVGDLAGKIGGLITKAKSAL